MHIEILGLKGERRDGCCIESDLCTSHQLPTPPAEFAHSSRACLPMSSILLQGLLQQESCGGVQESVHSAEFWECWKAGASEALHHRPGKRVLIAEEVKEP